MSSRTPEMSSPTKKKSLRKRLIGLFSRSESNLKDKDRIPSEESTSPSVDSSKHGAQHLDKKGRHSWSEKRGKKNRHESVDGVSEGAQSLPRLRHPRPEDTIQRRTSRTSKTRSLSYSDLDQPASGFLQRFGSLSWRKKRYSASEYSDPIAGESTPTDSHSSMTLTIDSEVGVWNRRPKSCIVESHCESPTLKGSKEIKRTSELAKSFDCFPDFLGHPYSSTGLSEGENATLQSSLTLSENLYGEEDESLPHWAENILKEYLSPRQVNVGSPLYPPVLGVLEEDEEPMVFQSPIYYHHHSTSESMQSVNSQNQKKSHILALEPSNTISDIQVLNPPFRRQLEPSILGQGSIKNQSHKPHKSKYTIILTQDKIEKEPSHTLGSVLIQDESHIVTQDNTPKNQTPKKLKYIVESGTTQNQVTLKMKHCQDEVDLGTSEVQSPPFKLEYFNYGKEKNDTPLYSSILGQSTIQNISTVSPAQLKLYKDHPGEQKSPITSKIRYEVIITMTKEESEKEGEEVSGLGVNLLRQNELAGPDLKLSPSLESQAFGYHGAGPAEVTAQEHLGSHTQTEECSGHEEDIPKEKKGGENFEGAHLDRSLVDECSLFPFGFEQKVENCRLHSSKMEKEVSLLRERPCSPYRSQHPSTHHVEKPHGQLNPRPGKIIIFSEPEFKGQKHEIYSDVGNTSGWELPDSISVRVVRGGWLLYEKPLFRGKRLMLLEGDTDLTCPWNIQKKTNKEDTNGHNSWIGSLRHVVKDFQIPQISLFPEQNGEGEKVKIVGPAPDTHAFGQPIKTESIIVHSGLWLLYSKPFFEGDPYILESGGYPNRKSWGGLDSHLCSLQPARIGGPTVEKPNEPKLHIFQYPAFEGHMWEVTRDLHSVQVELLTNVGSLKILGGCWVGYEKEGFRGHQYLLEEGEFRNWSHWGGRTEELGSLRLIRTDFSEPEIVLYEDPGCSEGPCLRLNEALADIEVAQYRSKTGSIHVLSGVWVAYENVDFSGEQYILEKGTYHNYQDWGAENSTICSLQPVLQLGGQNLHYVSKIQLFSEPNFHGGCLICTGDHILLPETFSPESCRVEGGSWILYEGEDCTGEQYVLSEGEYPTHTAMGCLTVCVLRSLRKVPFYFSVPSISLHGLERFEGKELEFSVEIRSLQGEGYNNHVLSVRVESGIWVLYEHSDFRGRQWLLEKTQIPNWLLYSGLQRVGSLCPIRQRRVYIRIRNRALNLFLSVPEQAEDMKAARVLVTEPKEGSCELWYYEEGHIKNQIAPHMSLQVVGKPGPGTKVVLWAEGRKPVQTWSLQDSGYIISHTFQGMCIDVKGGNSYDSDHVVVWEMEEDRCTQHWDVEVF
ncbi:beta/gamma crystallin domain-containing protein 2 [Pelobates fuscus]|uniref:beta/gamma crystallin domain-containing protein 2 n=1 Tax=Pelobates fuscus TaxID=191477 RepID=UPI002FE4F6DB